MEYFNFAENEKYLKRLSILGERETDTLNQQENQLNEIIGKKDTEIREYLLNFKSELEQLMNNQQSSVKIDFR